jgi:hypothetical protein
LLSNSTEDEREKEEGVAKWRKSVNINNFLDGTYDEEEKGWMSDDEGLWKNLMPDCTEFTVRKE